MHVLQLSDLQQSWLEGLPTMGQLTEGFLVPLSGVVRQEEHEEFLPNSYQNLLRLCLFSLGLDLLILIFLVVLLLFVRHVLVLGPELCVNVGSLMTRGDLGQEGLAVISLHEYWVGMGKQRSVLPDLQPSNISYE